jgi:hypothetical protein
LLDSQTIANLNAILTPEQQTQLAGMIAAISQQTQAGQSAQAQGGTGMGFQLGEVPIMDLNRLDQTVTSFKQMTEAGQLMLQAMKGLQQANPNPAGQ